MIENTINTMGCILFLGGVAVSFAPMISTSLIGILSNLYLQIFAGAFAGIAIVGFLVTRNTKDEEVPWKVGLGVMIWGAVGALACITAGLVFAYQQLATLGSIASTVSLDTLKNTIFGNILCTTTQSIITGPESLMLTCIAHHPLLMGLAPEVGMAIWDVMFFPLAGIALMTLAYIMYKDSAVKESA